VVVLSHEMGHFLLAKANGINVVEFTIGMGPKLIHFTKGGTCYSLRLLPIGGACIFEGEDGLNLPEDKETGEAEETEVVDVVEGTEKTEETGAIKKGYSFPDAPLYARLATVVAGPLFNFILAFLFSMIIVGSIGTDTCRIGGVSEGGAAEEAGIMAGDTITKIDGHKIYLYRELSIRAMLNKGEAVQLTYVRDGKTYEVVIHPKFDEKANRYYYGVIGERGYQKFGVLGTIKYSALEVRYWIDASLMSLKMLTNGTAGVKDLSGPVGMASTVDEIYTESKTDGAFYVWINMINFAVLLSANLGVLNLIPFPALDGGRIFILLIEAIRRKQIPPEKEGIVNLIGFVLLMILMVVVLYNDVAKLIVNNVK